MSYNPHHEATNLNNPLTTQFLLTANHINYNQCEGTSSSSSSSSSTEIPLTENSNRVSPEHILHSSSNAEGNTSAIGEQDNNTSTALQNIGSILAGEDFPLGTYIL